MSRILYESAHFEWLNRRKSAVIVGYTLTSIFCVDNLECCVWLCRC